MKINKKNYEIYFIDYFDGKLNPVESAELMYFLSENPNLEKEFNEFGQFNMPQENSFFPNKEILKKDFKDIHDISDANFEEFCVGAIEGDLDDQSLQKLQDYLKSHHNKNTDYQLYIKTKLIADESVIYSDKSALKKQRTYLINTGRILLYTGIAAAVIIVMFILRNSNKSAKTEITIAEITDNNKNLNEHASESAFKGEEELSTDKIPKSNKKSIKILNSKKSSLPVSNDTIKSSPKQRFEGPLYRIKPIEVVKLNPVIIPANDVLAIRTIEKQYPELREEEDKSNLARIRDRFSDLHLTESAEDINLWTLADAGLKGVNYLTESNIQLIKKTDLEGNLITYGLKAESFSFSTNRKK